MKFTDGKLSLDSLREEDKVHTIDEFNDLVRNLERAVEAFNSREPEQEPEQDTEEFRNTGINPEQNEVTLALSDIASWALSFLARVAGEGDAGAAYLFHKELRNALEDYAKLIETDNNSMLSELIQTEEKIPGFLSAHKPIMKDQLEKLGAKGLGRKNPWTESRPKLSTWNIKLAHKLFTHIMEIKQTWRLAAHEFQLRLLDDRQRIAMMLLLPPLTIETVVEWREVALRLIDEAIIDEGDAKGIPKGEMTPSHAFGDLASQQELKKFPQKLKDGFEAVAKSLE